MGLFDNLFGKKDNSEEKVAQSIPWIPLNSLDQLHEIEKKSFSKPQVIFKHSTSCGISRMVLNMFTSSYSFSEDELDLYYLDLHAFRDVSNETGYKFQVMHQSPQLLIIKDGVAVTHASHGAIADVDLGQYIGK